MNLDLDHALKWRVVWPLLRQLPRHESVSLLDAGCGAGAWCVRIARRRPAWRIVGIDTDAAQLERAKRRIDAAGLRNVTFTIGDLRDGIPGRYDVILSIASIHYAAAAGTGAAVLAALAQAVAPGGQMILLVPRRSSEQPVWRGLPKAGAWPVFGTGELQSMARDAGFIVTAMHGLFGSWCVLGKQAAMWSAKSRLRRLITLPVETLVRMVPVDLVRDPALCSYALLLIATTTATVNADAL